MALGVSTWQYSTLISAVAYAVAHAIGIPLWITTSLYLTFHLVSHNYFDGLASFPAAIYAFVAPSSCCSPHIVGTTERILQQRFSQ